jgi:hypothetical protein
VGTPDPPVVDEALEVRDVGDPSRRRLAAVLDLAKLVGGVYEASVTVTTASGETTAQRRFALEAR